jgi:hypothetical protein
MSRKAQSALKDCLDRMQAGESLEDCLARHPAHAAELRPLLTLADDIGRLPAPRPRPAARAAGQQRMLAAVSARFPAAAPAPAWYERRPILRWGVLLAAILVLLTASGWWSVTASATSLPGDTLYPVKRASEQVRLLLTFDQAAQQALQTQLGQERLDETQAVLEQGRQARVEFGGRLQAMTAASWLVGDIEVLLTPETRIDGEPVLGAWVRVRARATAEGELRALHLQIVTRRQPPPAAPASATSAPTRWPTASPSATLWPTPTRTPSPTYTAVPPRPTRPAASSTPPQEPERPTATRFAPTRTPRATATPWRTPPPPPLVTPRPTRTPRPPLPSATPWTPPHVTPTPPHVTPTPPRVTPTTRPTLPRPPRPTPTPRPTKLPGLLPHPS